MTQDPSEQLRLRKWKEELQAVIPVPPSEDLPFGENQPWIIWKTLNRLRTGVARTKVNTVNKLMGIPKRTGHIMRNQWRLVSFQ